MSRLVLPEPGQPHPDRDGLPGGQQAAVGLPGGDPVLQTRHWGGRWGGGTRAAASESPSTNRPDTGEAGPGGEEEPELLPQSLPAPTGQVSRRYRAEHVRTVELIVELGTSDP